MTLEEVAKRIGVGRPTVHKYESGAIAKIPKDKIEALATLFGVSKPFLAGWTDDENDNAGVPPGIPMPDNGMFAKAYSVMSYEDRVTITEIFERAYRKVREMEEEGKL